MMLGACSMTPALIKTQTPADISQQCDELPVFDGETADDLVSYNLDLISKYQQCSARHTGCQ